MYRDCGWFCWDPRRMHLNAHCGNPRHGKCHWDRTVRGKSNQPGQGRVLACHALWLSLAFSTRSRNKHQAMKLVLGDGAYYEDRAVLREEMLADEDMSELVPNVGRAGAQEE